MKVFLLSLAVLGLVAAEERALLVLPQFQQQKSESLERVSERVSERLAEAAGSQQGNYHVYLPDGRLQKVQFTAAPLRQQQSASSDQVFQRAQESSGPNPVVAHFGRLQEERLRQQLGQLRQQQQQLSQQSERLQQQLQQQKDFASDYVATVRFSDVPPIPAPIYAQGSQPLTRILRHLE